MRSTVTTNYSMIHKENIEKSFEVINDGSFKSKMNLFEN